VKKISAIFKTFSSLDIYTSNVDPSTILSEIEFLEKEEYKYIYESGDSARFISANKIYNPYMFNYFSLYNKNVYKAFLEIKSLFVEAATKKEVNIKRSYYYISSDYNSTMDPNFWYDMGGLKTPCFSGYYFLEVDKETFLNISDTEINISNGDIVLFESGRKVRINKGNSKIISFSIAPLQFITNQYPQKWMPIGNGE
jgi:hypothetical protein